MGLVEFLTARIDEDEAAARRTVQYGYDSDGPSGDIAWAGRQGREVAAKRAIMERLGGPYSLGWPSPDEEHYAAAGVLRHLGTIYADHPDYDEAWRPNDE